MNSAKLRIILTKLIWVMYHLSMIDLHLHSNRSDGIKSPLELLRAAEKTGLKAFSVTDHNNVIANDTITAELKKGGYRTKYITGTEISSQFKGKRLHLLCHGFNVSELKTVMEKESSARLKEIEAMIEWLGKESEINLTDEDKQAVRDLMTPNDLYVAVAVMNATKSRRHCKIIESYIHDGSGSRLKKDAGFVIDTVHDAGGMVSLAHPVDVHDQYKMSGPAFVDLIRKLKDRGLDGLEVFHPKHTESLTKAYSKIAQRYDLLVSGGSDYHNDRHSHRRISQIGRLTRNGVKIDDRSITLLSAFGV